MGLVEGITVKGTVLVGLAEGKDERTTGGLAWSRGVAALPWRVALAAFLPPYRTPCGVLP